MIRRLTLALSILALTTAAFADGVPRITSVTPSSGTVYGGDLVTITYENFSIDCPICSPPFVAGVLFGGVPSTDVRPFGDGKTIAAVTPTHGNPGPVAVSIVNYQNAAVTAPGAFTYVAADLDRAGFEMILIPAPLVEPSSPLPGANGSKWVSDLYVRNGGNAGALTFLPDAICKICSPSTPPEILPPGATRRYGGYALLPGHYLFVQKAELDFYAFSLRVRDVSRAAQNEGTEIPVVRESELRNRPIQLLNVPLNATSRAALRVFETKADPFSAPVAYVTITSLTDSHNAAFVRLSLSYDSASDDFPYAPGYATINDLRAATSLPEGQYRVEVIPQNYTGWAFVAVTNNETQLVTAITPK